MLLVVMAVGGKVLLVLPVRSCKLTVAADAWEGVRSKLTNSTAFRTKERKFLLFTRSFLLVV